MSEQYCLFDEKRAAEDVGPYKPDERAADSHAYERFRRATPGTRFFKVGMMDGTIQIIETTLSMLELGNELRNKQKIKIRLVSRQIIDLRSQDVRYLENMIRVPV